MINLITGGPGSGKTNMVLGLIYDEIVKENRILYVHCVPNLKIPHRVIKCDSVACIHCKALPPSNDYIAAAELHKEVPEGSLILLDEAQHIYRPRSSASKVPENVAFLETHRHSGFDLWILSQSPKLIDGNVRELVTMHRHLLVKFHGRKFYEWPECHMNPQTGRQEAIHKGYKLNKKVFDLYLSSTLHTKQSRTMPLTVYMLPVILVVMAVMGYMVKERAEQRFNFGEQDEVAVEGGGASNLAAVNADPYVITEDFFRPSNAYLLETAPIYNGMVKAKDFPRKAACVADESLQRCECFTQQGTKYPTDYLSCLDQINNKNFNPFFTPRSTAGN